MEPGQAYLDLASYCRNRMLLTAMIIRVSYSGSAGYCDRSRNDRA
jgi:hypothetical protein